MAVRKDQRSQSSPVAAWLRDAVEKDPALGRMLEQLERVAGSDDPACWSGPVAVVSSAPHAAFIFCLEGRRTRCSA